MKRLVFPAALLSGVLLSACVGNSAQSEVTDVTTQYEDTVETNSSGLNEDLGKLVDYLKFVDGDKFVLDITEEEAIKAGISKEAYETACEDIRRENANIQEYKKSELYKQNGGKIKIIGLRGDD